MKLTEAILAIKTPNLTVEYFASSNAPYQYILKTDINGLIAVGWKIDDEVDEQHYFLYGKIISFADECRETNLLTIKELNDWRGLVFVINSKSIWHCPFNVINPTSNKENSFDNFLKHLKSGFPELKSESETQIDNLILSEQKTKELEETNTELEQELKQLKEKIKKLEVQSQSYAQNLKDSNEQLEAEKKKIIILEKANRYFSELNKESIIKKLTKKQIQALLNIMQGSYTTYTGLKFSLNNIEVNLDLFHPKLLIKISSTESVAWDTATDYITLPTFKYELIQKNGKKETISIGEISKNPKAIFGERGLWLSDLKCCTWINVDDLKLKDNGK